MSLKTHTSACERYFIGMRWCMKTLSRWAVLSFTHIFLSVGYMASEAGCAMEVIMTQTFTRRHLRSHGH